MHNKNFSKLLAENVRLKEENDLYKNIFASVNAYIFVYNINEGKVFWENHNNYLYNLLGYHFTDKLTLEESINPAHPDDKAILYDRINYFKENKGEIYYCTYRLKHINGNYKQVYSVCKVFKRDFQNNIISVIGVATFLDFEFLKNNSLANLLINAIKHLLFLDNYKIFTETEKQILNLFFSDKPYKEISSELDISTNSLNHHITRMNRKIIKTLFTNNIQNSSL
ncbi:MAG: PAS domain-containing protein [Bacteroidales bacterium]|nr:PAS domain-containing protein [Bacteroidales bacterium]